MPNDAETLVYQKAMLYYKIAFDKAARAAGGTVRFGSQHSLLWGAMNDGGHGAFHSNRWEGVCAGLSMEWMKYMTQGKDFMALFYKIRNEVMGKQEGPKFGVAGFASTVGASQARQDNIAGVLAAYFTPVGSPQTYSAPYTKFSGSVKAGNYYYLSTGSPTMPGHATAARMVGSGRVDYYDPNVGEIVGTAPRFFDSYLREIINGTAVAKGLDAAETEKLFARKQITVRIFRPIR